MSNPGAGSDGLLDDGLLDSDEADGNLDVWTGYDPRPHFIALHESRKRLKFVVAHRRAGKTVALVNELIRAASVNPRRTPPPRYAYVGSSFDAAKDLVWGYCKQYTRAIPGMNYLEGELSVTFPTGAQIRLYGGALAYERMRGLYFDGIVMDEYPLLHPQAFTSVVRPALGDYLGFAVVSGTSNGEDHFHELMLKAEDDPDWDIFVIPVTATHEDALSHREVEAMRKDMSAAEFAREMLCSFEATVEGAYYEEALNAIAMQHRIAKVPPDLNTGVITAWDLGIRHLQVVWLFQICGRELHWIDYIEGTGKALSHYANLLEIKSSAHGFKYRAHLLPHDIEVRELSTGVSRRQELVSLLKDPVITVPNHSTEDGVTATRGALGVSWFDEAATRKGLARLRAYRKGRTGIAVADAAEDAADAFRTGCVGMSLLTGSFGSHGAGKRLRRRLRGLI